MTSSTTASLFVSQSTLEQLIYSFIGLYQEQEVIKKHLIASGFSVGVKIAIASTSKLGRLLVTDVEKIKFIGRDIWNMCFEKSIDRIEKQKNGLMFVLQDNDFQWFQTISAKEDFKVTNYFELCMSFVQSFVKGVFSTIFPCYHILVKYEIFPFDENNIVKVPERRIRKLGRRRVVFHINLEMK